MKYLRTCGIVVFLTALGIFGASGTASATTLLCGSGTLCAAGTTIKAASEGKVVLDAPFGNVECESTIEGHTTTSGEGGSAGNADGPITALSWSNCGGDTVSTLATGTLSVASAGGSNGTLTSKGSRVTVIHLGVHCIYETSSTSLGTVTGSNTTGANATLDISATIPRVGGNGGAFCGSSAPWTGSYKFTSPATLNVESEGGTAPTTPEEGEKIGITNPAANEYFFNCFQGAPVDCASGNQTEAQTDLALNGRGPALAITRSYNSQAAAVAKEAGPWGYGWSGPYSSHLEINKETGAVTVVQENGATVAFARSGGKYVAGAWIQATLVKETVESKEIYVFTLPTQEKLKFNSEGKLTEQKDRNGNAITLSYESGKLKTVKDAAGRELLFTFTGSQVTQVEDPMGHKVKYAYESGNLVSVTLPGEESARWKFKYDASHQLTEMTDGRGGVTKTEYDAKHRVTKQTDPMERVTKWEYGESEGKKTTTITEPNGSTTFEKFNEAGEPLEVIKAKGTAIEQKSTNEYNTAYEMTKATDALSHSTTYEYSAAGDRTVEKDPEGDERKWTYNASHEVETETTPKGEKTTYKRDSHGNIEAIERLGPGETTQKWTFKHAENGDLESETDPLGHETKFEYDSYGDKKAETDAEGDKTTWTYDKDGYATAEVSPRGNEEGAKASEFETTTERDAQERLIKVTDPLGHATTEKYDGNGNLESTTDALGHTTKYAYDADNEKTKIEAANGTTTETAYDSMGQVKSKTDGNGKTTKYEHNGLEQLTETIDPLERKTTREYDKAGNLEKLKDPEGRTTTFSYDKANRLTKKSYSEEATHAVEYSYDKDGDVVKMIDGTGTTETTYDVLDRPTEVKNGNGEVVKYEYNLGSLQTKITYPNSKSVSREYDKANRLTKVTDWLSHSTTFSYSRESALKATVFPTEAVDEDISEYNRADQLTKQTFKKGSETLAQLTYARDALGQVESTTQTGLPGSETLTNEYDKANRLTKSGETGFEYDNAGNPLKLGLTELKYDSASELEKGGTTSYSFDKLGERTKATPGSGPATSYGYDQAGNLVSVNRSAEGEISKVEDSYAYDGNGLRQSETISGTTKHFAWDTAESLPLLLSDGSNYYVYGPEGLPIEQIASETPTYLHHDQQGSTRLLTSQAGATSGTYTFTPYGQTEGHTGTASSPLGYDGQYTSPDTGLIYLRARVYDPATAQFLSVDPLVAKTGEAYGFAAQNPVNRGDPNGMQQIQPIYPSTQQHQTIYFSPCQQPTYHTTQCYFYRDAQPTSVTVYYRQVGPNLWQRIRVSVYGAWQWLGSFWARVWQRFEEALDYVTFPPVAPRDPGTCPPYPYPSYPGHSLPGDSELIYPPYR
ncbi:MAG: RHS repeat-associated core domain-containing protein [Solirubrobacterales bacterium]